MAKLSGSDSLVLESIQLDEQAEAPANPPEDKYKLFVDDAGALNILNSAGTATPVGGGGGGGGTLRYLQATGSISSLADSSSENVDFESVTFNQGGLFNPGGDSTRLLAPVAGIYHLDAEIYVDIAEDIQFSIYVNVFDSEEDQLADNGIYNIYMNVGSGGYKMTTYFQRVSSLLYVPLDGYVQVEIQNFSGVARDFGVSVRYTLLTAGVIA